MLKTVVNNVSHLCTHSVLKGQRCLFLCVLTGDPLPLPSLRLLVPPLQLMMASMWQVLKKRDVLNYWTLAEYVSLVVDIVPDLLTHKPRLQLLLGLRARVASQLNVASWYFVKKEYLTYVFFLYFSSSVYSGVVPK